MNADNFGSFSITCRLMRALSTVAKDDPTNRRSRVLQSFFEKYSTSPSDLTTLLELLLARVDSETSCMNGVGGLSGTERELVGGLMDDWLVRCCDVIGLKHVPFASFGNLTLAEARRVVSCLQAVGGIATTTPGSAPRTAAITDSDKLGSGLPQSITEEEWCVLKNIACGDAHASVGPNITEGDLIGMLGPVATTVYCTQGRHVRRAVVASSDGSPRMIRESSGTDFGAADDAAAGFASDPEDDVPALAAPSEYGSKRPREEEQHAAAATMSMRKDKEVTLISPGPATSAAVRRMYPCMYGAACRRTNPDHFKKYSHPPLPTVTAATTVTAASGVGVTLGAHHDAAGPSWSMAATAAASPPLIAAAAPAGPTSPPPLDPAGFAVLGVAPLRAMKEHEFVFADNSGGGYKMKNCGGGTYTCNCPVWRYQNKGTNERTCKHLQAYLGEAFERVRCGGEDGATPLGGAPAAAKRPGSPTAGGRKVAMPGVLLANKASNKGDYKDWWVSEKLDGVRAYWDGSNLLSRNGNIFTAPEAFTKVLPKDRTLDGELFGGRKKFQTTVGIVKSSAAHPGWSTLTYEVFDTPSSGEKPFEIRMAELAVLFPNHGPIKHVHVVEQEKCTGAQYVSDRLAEVEAVGGEGLMLREPGSRYVHSRSNTLLKVKSTEEVDAIVRGHDPGKGKHAGRCGALLVELANGKQFCVGSGLTDAQRNAPPSVGTVIVVKFQELTDGGIPRFPVFVGCRFDIDWPPKGKPAS